MLAVEAGVNAGPPSGGEQSGEAEKPIFASAIAISVTGLGPLVEKYPVPRESYSRVQYRGR